MDHFPMKQRTIMAMPTPTPQGSMSVQIASGPTCTTHKNSFCQPLYQGCESGSGSRRAKMTHKNRKKYRNFMFWSAGCSLLRAEGFSCSLGVLYGGLGISKLEFLIKKIKIKFPSVYFFNFSSSNPGSGSGIRNPDPQLEKMLYPDPYPDTH
jgi:hypothetical protein